MHKNVTYNLMRPYLLALTTWRWRRDRREGECHRGQRRRVVQLVVMDVRRRGAFRYRMPDGRLHRILVVVAGGSELGRLVRVHGRVVEEPSLPSRLLGEVNEGVCEGPPSDLVHER